MLYDFECPDCGKFEVNQKMLDKREANCPECGKPATFIPCWNGGIIFNFPSLDASDIMRQEGKWNY